MHNHHPTAGVRILLELEEADGDGARYRAAIFTPTERYHYQLAIELPAATVRLEPSATPEAAAYDDFVRAMSRSLARDALTTSPPAWPQHLLRWRDK